MRYERHKDRQRERNIARAAPDKRQVLWSCDDRNVDLETFHFALISRSMFRDVIIHRKCRRCVNTCGTKIVASDVPS
jgi:hypothetical protein